jgi:PqqD family protein of HPr-rel-A system
VHRWVCVKPGLLRWACWEPDSAVFHGETGETHLLSALPAYVLQLLQDRAKSTDEICRAAAVACETSNDDAWHRKVLAILRNLQDLELIEREAAPRA